MASQNQIVDGTVVETYVVEGQTRAKILVVSQLLDVKLSPDEDLRLGDAIRVTVTVCHQSSRHVRQTPDAD